MQSSSSKPPPWSTPHRGAGALLVAPVARRADDARERGAKPLPIAVVERVVPRLGEGAEQRARAARMIAVGLTGDQRDPLHRTTSQVAGTTWARFSATLAHRVTE